MDIRAFAGRLKGHDWFFAMSDDQGVWASGERALAELRATAALGGNYKRLLTLAAEYYTQMDGMCLEKAWRYAGGHLWVHGVKCSEEEAQEFVDSEEDPKYGVKHRVNWKKVNEAIEECNQ